MLRSEVLAIRPFRNLWLGQATSQVGDAFYYVIFMFMVERLTGSIAMVGYVGAAETLPFLLFSVTGGVAADRFDRRRIMLLSDLLSALALLLFAAVLLFNATPPIWTIFVTAFSLSTVRAFFMPAKNASIPALVPRELLLKANSVSAATQNVMPLLSLTLSMSVMATLYALSQRWFFLFAVLFNAVSFLGSAYFIAKLPKIVPQGEKVKMQPVKELREGLSYVRRRRELTVLLILQALMSLAISPFFVVYVAANKEWFGRLPTTLAMFEFCFFVGMIVSSLLVGRLNMRRPGQGFIWGLGITGLTVAAMALSPHVGSAPGAGRELSPALGDLLMVMASGSFLVFVVCNIAAGLAVPFAQVPIATYVQGTVSDNFRGRVTSLMTMVQMGVTPIGLSLGGLLIKSAGLGASFLFMGGGMVVAASLGLLDRSFRNMRLPEAEPVNVDDGGDLKPQPTTA
jgi:MFS transporter, DHA3 family, macrolide efflux protein